MVRTEPNKPAIGDDDAIRGEPGLDEAERERRGDGILVAELAALHGLRALVHLAAHHDARDAVADRVHLAALVRGLAADAHEAGHVVRVEHVPRIDRVGEATEEG
eukprot:2777837-Prymnesium_polylepis.1